MAGLVGETTDMRVEGVAAVVDGRVADVKVEEATVVMEAMVEVAEEEEVEDGEGHQVAAPISIKSWTSYAHRGRQQDGLHRAPLLPGQVRGDPEGGVRIHQEGEELLPISHAVSRIFWWQNPLIYDQLD